MLSKITALWMLIGIGLYVFLQLHKEKGQWICAGMALKHWICFFAVPFAFFSVVVYQDYLMGFTQLFITWVRLSTDFGWEDFFAFHLLQFVFYTPLFFGLGLWLMIREGKNLLGIGIVFLKETMAQVRKKSQSSSVVAGGKQKQTRATFFQSFRRLQVQLGQEKYFFLLLSLPGTLYLLLNSFTVFLHPNWTVFATIGILFLVALFLAKHFDQWRYRVIFHGSVAFVTLVILALPVIFFSNLPTFSLDGTCLYKKYSFLEDGEFQTVYRSMDKTIPIVGSSYKIPSIINLRLRPETQSIILRSNKELMGDFRHAGYNLFDMLLERKDGEE